MEMERMEETEDDQRWSEGSGIGWGSQYLTIFQEVICDSSEDAWWLQWSQYKTQREQLTEKIAPKLIHNIVLDLYKLNLGKLYNKQ